MKNKIKQQKIPDGWIRKSLMDLNLDVVTGKTPSTKDKSLWKNEVDFITPTDIKNYHIKYDYEVERKISKDFLVKNERYSLPKNSVCFVCIGSTIGKMCMTKKDISTTNQQINSIKPNKDFDMNFIFYALKNIRWSVKKEKANEAVKGIIKKSDFELIEINIPKLKEQNVIADVLSSFDNKIEHLKKQNENLEKIGKLIFKKMFIENAKDDWEEKKILDIAERKTINYRCESKDLEIKGITPIIDQGETGIYGYTNRDADFFASKESPIILFTNHTCNFWFIDYPFCAIQNIIPINGIKGYDNYFIYFLIKDSINFIEYKGHWPDFANKSFKIPLPKDTLKFSNIAKNFMFKISNNQKQIKILEKSRDALLPKLISGKIRVKI